MNTMQSYLLENSYQIHVKPQGKSFNEKKKIK